MSGIDRIFQANQTNYSTGVQKTNKLNETSNIIFNNKPDALNNGFMGVSINPEARMAAQMEQSPFMKALDELFV